MLNTIPDKERAALFGVHTDSRDYINDCTDGSMQELQLLAETAGAEVVGAMVQNRQTPDNATYFGEGKIDELADFCKASDIDIVICDDELSGTQVKNIESLLDTRVIDRSSLIMDIFAQRAKTKEGQLQVELAQLRYFLPRLTGSFTALSRQVGRSTIGGALRGPGETKLETDRRHIRERIQTISRQLIRVKKHRQTQRKQRTGQGITQIAIVGYTNSGKSTLLNHLTGAGVLTMDKLFATLDPTAKKLMLPDGTDTIVIDTVGFIRKLPHHLINAFMATLEETVNADILLHVVDASSPNLEDNIKIAEDTLAGLDALGKPMLTVFNKIDLVPDRADGGGNRIEISAKTGQGVDNMLNAICGILPDRHKRVTVIIPYDKSEIVSALYKDGRVFSKLHEEAGTKLDVAVDARLLSIVGDYIV